MYRVESVTPLCYKIGTFNCKNLSINNAIKISSIADLIKESDVDIVALQEISNISALKIIVTELGDEYNEIHCDQAIDFHKVHEYMGFIYKTKYINAVRCITFSNSQKQLYVANSGKLMKRAPVYARFVLNNATDIILTSFHTNQQNPIHDCLMIHKCIKAIQITNDCKQVIALGDFNTSCGNKFAFAKLLKFSYMPCLPSHIATNNIQTEQYDNIWYPKLFCDIKESATVWNSVAVSDHFLVTANICMFASLSKDYRSLNDPDLTAAINFKMLKKNLISIPCCSSTEVVCTCRDVV